MVIRRSVDYHADLVGRDRRRKREPALDAIVSGHAAAGNGYPGRAVPVLHVEVSDAIGSERGEIADDGTAVEVVLQSVDVDRIDRLHHVEIDLDVIRVDVARAVVPAAAAAPVVAVVFAIDGAAGREVCVDS